MQRYSLLGTAGHIDHGKTSLIRALTGVDTDRLPEEKRRGITVDLGFAALELDGIHLGIVDVPGHERFVKNMLSGAMGIDLVLLVVAADEGVMRQTREHFEAISYLRLSAGVIAITKCDLVEEEMLELVDEEVSDLVAGSFLQDSSIVHVSTKTNNGLDTLREELRAAAWQLPTQPQSGPFKLSVDRCFSATGQGTVVTGSVASGSCSVGDSLELLPQADLVTVRKIESHGQSFESVGKGQRAALNLSGVHYSTIHRGDVLCTSGSIVPSDRLSVQISASRFSKAPLKNLTGIRFYTGATETPGRIRLLESDKLRCGDSQLAQIELKQPVCTHWGEPFVMRGLASNEVLGGGQIIDPCAARLSRRDTTRIERLREIADGDECARTAASVALLAGRAWTNEELWQRTGVLDTAAVLDRLTNSGELIRFNVKGNSRWLHRDTVTAFETRLLDQLRSVHQEDSLSPMVPLGRLKPHFGKLEPAGLLTRLAERLHTKQSVRLKGDFVALHDWRPKLSANQTALLEELIQTCRDAGVASPSVAELAEKFAKTPDELEALLKVASSSGELIRLPDRESRDAKASQRARIYMHRDVVDEVISRVSSVFSEHDQWTISQFGEATGLSRKYAIPLCGYLDQTGITVRQGDRRALILSISNNS